MQRAGSIRADECVGEFHKTDCIFLRSVCADCKSGVFCVSNYEIWKGLAGLRKSTVLMSWTNLSSLAVQLQTFPRNDSNSSKFPMFASTTRLTELRIRMISGRASRSMSFTAAWRKAQWRPLRRWTWISICNFWTLPCRRKGCSACYSVLRNFGFV